MSDTTITPEERAEWRERLTSKFSCFDAELSGFTLRLLDVFEQSEAKVDWLAEKCAMHCHDMSRDDIMCTVDTCDILTCWGASGDEWKEAARRAVADSEVKG
ncbi:hypothetical protein [Desulfovibrio desulfuricans]|uniref:hypothetical protein n=1 Tax=Desulfovibrio desulfuricans TaxID=876 RepID=UPI003983F78E